MLFSKKAKSFGPESRNGEPSVYRFLIPNSAEEIVIKKDDNEVSTIHFDIFLEDKHKVELAAALWKSDFLFQYKFRREIGLLENPKIAEEEEYFNEYFSSDDYEFAKNFAARTLVPMEIALRVAYLIACPFDEHDLSEKNSILEHFLSGNPKLLLQSKGWAKGVTTFEAYYHIATQSSLEVADFILNQEQLPAVLLVYAASIAQLSAAHAPTSRLNPQQFSKLLMISTNLTRMHPEEIESLVSLISSVNDWDLVGRKLKEIPSDLQEFVGSIFFRGTRYTPSFGRGEIYRPFDKAWIDPICAILSSLYSEDVINRSIEILAKNDKIINTHSVSYFSAFVACLEASDSGGVYSEQLDWIVSFEPSIDKNEFFSR